jgi:hypothetical protein
MDEQHDWFTNKEVANHYRTTVATVRHWRLIGYGPKGTKVGARVLYPQSEIDRFDAHLARQLTPAAG